MKTIRIPEWREQPSEYDNRKVYTLHFNDEFETVIYRAELRNDGCTDLYEPAEDGYEHICSLEQRIADLLALRMIQEGLEQEGWVY